jgi:hypothetical protein
MEVNALSSSERARMREKALPAVSALIKSSYGEKGEQMLELFLSEIAKASN